MTLRKFGMGLIACTMLGAGAASAGPTYYLLAIPGIPGESALDRYRETIELLNFSLGFDRGVCSALTVTKSLDVSSPLLTAAAMTEQFFPSIRLYGYREGENPLQILTLTLQNSVIVRVQTSGSAASNERPTESVSIQPTSVEITYRSQNERGQTIPVTQRVDCARVK